MLKVHDRPLEAAIYYRIPGRVFALYTYCKLV